MGVEVDDREVEMAIKSPVVDSRAPGDADIPREMARWAIAAMIAGVALMGLFALVAAVVFLVELPAWVQAVGGVVLALGTAGFAWLVASALAASRHDAAEAHRPRRTTDIGSRR